ncbi:MAG: carboxypeptidase regulatory-like domain-containing protein [Deltaproteobacteria bacterium]|nr:carboxypeptidase regulatory-like domain-containing protein [Deltaproteobacteria bacterium]
MIRLLPMALRSRSENLTPPNPPLIKGGWGDFGWGFFIFFILPFAFLIVSSPVLAAAITGKVEIAGSYSIKPRKNLEEGIKAERSLIVSKDGGIKDAVVFIKGINLSRDVLKREETSSLIQKEVAIDQKRKAFIPHVLPILVGTTVTFKNSDPFVHRIISNSETKKIRMEFAYEGATMNVTFDKSGVVDVWCDDHKRMQGWILVMETPFFAATDGKGDFIISNVPPGRYTIEVWHEVLGVQTQEIEVKEGKDNRVDFRLPGKEF